MTPRSHLDGKQIWSRSWVVPGTKCTGKQRPKRRACKKLLVCQQQGHNGDKQVIVQTRNKDVLTSALESGIATFLFDSSASGLAEEWRSLAKFTALLVSEGAIMDAASERQVTRQNTTAHTGLHFRDCTNS